MTTIREYRSMLPVSKHRLDDELEVQADVQDRIATERNKAELRMGEAKENLAQVEARLFKAAKEEDEKCTDKAAEASARRDPDRARAFALLQQAKFDLDEWSSLYEAWKSRGFSLRGLGDLFGDQYFAIDSAGARPRRSSDGALAARPAYRPRALDAPAARKRIES